MIAIDENAAVKYRVVFDRNSLKKGGHWNNREGGTMRTLYRGEESSVFSLE